MRCPACQKRVVFGSIRGKESWDRIERGEWLLGGRQPKAGQLGDCPVCGVRLEWEAGEEREAALGSTPRVHLSALRESPQAWRGRVALRALVIEVDGVSFASDSWRVRAKAGGEPESDATLVRRLLKEQQPRIQVAWSQADASKAFHESSRLLEDGSRAAWVEVEGSFEPGEGGGVVSAAAVTSIWPPKD